MTSEYSQYYKKLLDFEPYGYQKEVADILLKKKKNVILSVPTGSGKTWGSIMPFLYAQQSDLYFPKKMIYSLPLRTLTNSIYHDVTNILLRNGYSEDEIKRQTGEFSDDKFLEKEIIFSTIDQTLSSFLCFPLSLSHRQANINAGALIGSYLIFDEFHLLDPALSMATTLGMLKMLENLCRCCIMTATLSNDFMEALKENLTNFEIVTLNDFPKDQKKIKSLIPEKNKKLISVKNQPLTSKEILEKHKDKTIVICNRVETCQKVFQDLVKTLHKENPQKIDVKENVICLHSRFFDNDRKRKENKLKLLLGKQARNKKTNTILISTQVIEAGMDISCDIMHTEISPVNSFLQRAGRCARFEGETGEILVYNILNPKELLDQDLALKKNDKKEIQRINNKYLPYDHSLCLATFNTLKNYNTLDGNVPQKLIEEIIGGTEMKVISSMSRGQKGGFNQDKIIESWESCLKNHYRSTIRDIQSVDITIICDELTPEVERYPYGYQSLSMYKWSFVSWLKKIEDGEGPIKTEEEQWLVKGLEENMFVGEIENDEEVKFQLIKLTNFRELPPQVYANSRFFGYSSDFGFNWQYPNTFNTTAPRKEKKDKIEKFEPLKKDTFFQHNMGLIRCFEKEFWPKLQGFTIKELISFIEAPNLTERDFEKLFKLMIILHDYGKLSEAWQKPMQRYQASKENIPLEEFNQVLGHTDFDALNPVDLKLGEKVGLHKRPGHSGVGAFVAQEVLPQLYDEELLKSTISMAISRHHGPLSNSFPSFNIPQLFYSPMKNLLNRFEFSSLELNSQELEDQLDGFETGWNGERILYLFFVRILRLCDQKATENLKKYYK